MTATNMQNQSPTDTTAALVREFKIGKRRTVTFTAPPLRAGGVLHLTCEWEPAMPAGGLTGRDLSDYRLARHAFLTELAELVGGRIAVVEV